MSRKNLISLLLLSLLASSCIAYKPQLSDVPLIDHKGDVRIAASAYLHPLTGFDATMSAGISNHIAAQLHVDFHGPEIFYQHAAIGLFFPTDNNVFETYLGIGRGNADLYIDADPANARGPYVCDFLQINYGWRHNTKNAFGFALKGGAMIPNIRWNGPANIEGATTMSSGQDTEPHLMLEPQVFYRIGGEHVKFQIQLGYSYIRHNLPVEFPIYYPISLSTGISINL